MAVSFFMLRSARGGIRTHEAEAVDLKSTPFDRSGTLAGWSVSSVPVDQFWQTIQR